MIRTLLVLAAWGLVWMVVPARARPQQLKPVYALATAPGGGVWLASRSSVVHLDSRRRLLGRLAFPDAAKVSIDGLGVTPDALWISGWFGARFPTSRGVLLPSGSPTGFVGVWDPHTLELRWIMRLGTDGALARRLAVVPDGSAWVVGGVKQQLGVGQPQPMHGDIDAFALHLSAAGTVLQSLRFGTPGQDIARGVAVGPDGSVAIVGMYGGPTEREPSGEVHAKWTLSAGPVKLAHHGDSDGFVLLLDSKGRVRYGAALAEVGFDVAKDIRPMAGGWVVVGSMKRVGGGAGHFSGEAHLKGFVSWLDNRARILRIRFPDGVLSVHALAADKHGLWAAGHAGVGHRAREAELFRIGPHELQVAAHCKGAIGTTLGYAVAAGRNVWFGGIAHGPVQCVGAQPARNGWALFRLR